MAFYLTLEGVDGAGKSTLAKMLVRDLKHREIRCVLTQEPGSEHSPFCQAVKALIERSPINARTELLMFLAARAEHWETVVKPALAQGAVVVSVRGPDSSWVYQGFMLDLDIEQIEAFNAFALEGRLPDLTCWLDVSPDMARARARHRFEGQGCKYDREELATFRHLRAGYSFLVSRSPERIVPIAVADRETKEVVFQRIKDVLFPRLGLVS